MLNHITRASLILMLGIVPAQAQQTAAPAAVAAGDPVKGEASAKKCVACHSFEEGGPHKVGPNLYGVLGRPVASAPEYKYSDAMIAFSEGGAKLWTVEELDAYLLNPRQHVPGTKMAFAGLKADDERANVIAYLATLGATPAQ